MSVREAQLKIDSAEFSEWMAYSKIEPFYQNRLEQLLAIIASVMINVNRKKGSRAVKPEDFLHNYHQPRPRDSADEIYTKLRSIFGGHNQ